MKAAIRYILLALPLCSFSDSYVSRCTQFYNSILLNQSAIEKINHVRPKIYIYTDFGGGKNGSKALMDLQTSGEIASAGWKATLQKELFINDSAAPLSPREAAIQLAATFPYVEIANSHIHTIVVHVVDPGVGNQQEEQPRSAILRRDGVLFIGPDNGTLSFAVPPGSIASAWEINPDALHSSIDVKAGGTFHGRDLFSESAFRIAAGTLSLDEIGHLYPHLELKNRFRQPSYIVADPIKFEALQTDRLIWKEEEIFDQAYLLGIIQSSLYQDETHTASKKLFIIQSESPLIAISNQKTGNIYIGPNNGLGTSFFKNFSHKEFDVFSLASLAEILFETNNEVLYAYLQQQPRFLGQLIEVSLLSDSPIRDISGRLKKIDGNIWVDLYGNIKTTVPSSLLIEAKKTKAHIKVRLNGEEKEVIFANTFSEVPENQLFIYSGSTGQIGPNPHRSERYVEITANGIYGKFGTDFFNHPKSGDPITFQFEY